MNKFLIADQHFRHSNILSFEDRPFASLEEMEAEMIKAWNAAVGKNDEVLMLGDFCFGGRDVWTEILDQLKGRITLIKGNHCKTKVATKMVHEGLIHEYHPLGTILKVDSHILNLSHYPLGIGIRPRNWSIHGHLHANDGLDPNMINVGVDNAFAKSFGRPFGTPIPLEDLIVSLNQRLPAIEALFAEQKAAQNR